MLDEVTPLPSALTFVQQTKNMIAELNTLLPASSNPNFRERLVAHCGDENSGIGFRLKAKELLDWYKVQFGVDDLIDS
jgi:hypothetical protein